MLNLLLAFVAIGWHQAQESGEQFGIADDVRYALDGLAAGPATRRASAVALAEIAATRRGRLVLRCAAPDSTHACIFTAGNLAVSTCSRYRHVL